MQFKIRNVGYSKVVRVCLLVAPSVIGLLALASNSRLGFHQSLAIGGISCACLAMLIFVVSLATKCSSRQESLNFLKVSVLLAVLSSLLFVLQSWS